MKPIKRTLEALIISVGVGLSSVGCKEKKSEAVPQPEPVSKVEYQPNAREEENRRREEDKEARERLEKIKKEMELREEESVKRLKLYEERVKNEKRKLKRELDDIIDDVKDPALREVLRSFRNVDEKKNKMEDRKSGRPAGYYDFDKNPDLYVRENPDDPLGYLLVCKNLIDNLNRQIIIHNINIQVYNWDSDGFGDVEDYTVVEWLREARSNCDEGNDKLENQKIRLEGEESRLPYSSDLFKKQWRAESELCDKFRDIGKRLDKNLKHLEKQFSSYGLYR